MAPFRAGAGAVLAVSADGDDWLVRDIRVNPASGYSCKTVTRMPHRSLAGIAGGLDLERARRQLPQTRGLRVMAADQFASVVQCAAEIRVLRVPDYWTVDVTRLKSEQPEIASVDLGSRRRNPGIRRRSAS